MTVAVLAPLPYGSIGPQCIILWSVVLGCALASTPHDMPSRGGLRDILLVLAMFAIYGFIALGQWMAWSWLFPAAPIWDEASRLLGTRLTPSGSVDPDRTIEALGTPLLYAIAIIAGAQLGLRRGQSSRLISVLSGASIFYALFGIASYLIDPKDVLWVAKEKHIESLTGTFFNRNTEAAFLGAAITMNIAIVADRAKQFLLIDFKIQRWPGWLYFRLVVTAILFCALFMTHSRAGVYLTFLSILLSVLFFSHRFGTIFRDRRGFKSIKAISFMLFVVITLIFETTGSGLEARLRRQGVSDLERLGVYRSTAHLILEHPVTGSGIGTFELVFPAYRDTHMSVMGIWQKAHSTILELGAEAGIPFALAVCGVWAFILRQLLMRAFRDATNTISFVAALVLGQAGLHSLLDYPLQIPGFGLIVAVLVGAGLSRRDTRFYGNLPGDLRSAQDLTPPRRTRHSVPLRMRSKARADAVASRKRTARDPLEASALGVVAASLDEATAIGEPVPPALPTSPASAAQKLDEPDTASSS